MVERKWFGLSFLFGLAVIVHVSEGRLLKMSGPVTATASSYYVSPSGLEFAPNLAIQADTSRVGSSCFISNKTRNPWFSLEFKQLTSIANVRLVMSAGTKKQMPSDFLLNGTLSVNVSNSSVLQQESEQSCDEPRSLQEADINLDCKKELKGRFVHVRATSTSSTYLLICCIVLQSKSHGQSLQLNVSEEMATVISNQSDSNQNLYSAVDGNASSCSRVTNTNSSSSSVKWLMVDIRSVRYIKRVSILFNVNEARSAYTVVVGRNLRGNESEYNTQCNQKEENTTQETGVHWSQFVCSMPVFGQFIYVSKKGQPLTVCGIQVFYEDTVNIYSSVRVSASDQSKEASPIWTPIDGIADTNEWISLRGTKSWWRLQFPSSITVSRVIIYTRQFSDDDEQMQLTGTAVYIGNYSYTDMNRNSMCGDLWSPPSPGQHYSRMSFNCSINLQGKYLYVTAPPSRKGQLYLREISVHECKELEQRAMISSNISQMINVSQSANLTCSATTDHGDCTIKEVIWKDPSGQKITSTFTITNNSHVVSSVVVAGFTFGGPYTCEISYQWFSLTATYNLSVKAVVDSIAPSTLTVLDGDSTSQLFCEAKGYPPPTLTWKKNKNTILQEDMYTQYRDNVITRSNLTIGAVSLSDNGTVYQCEAKQGSVVSHTERTLLVTADININISPQLVVEFAGHQVTFVCEVTGASAYVTLIQWFIGLEIISQNSTYTITSESVDGRHTSSLTIAQLQLFHGSLKYHCIAQNNTSGIFSKSKEALVRVLGGITEFKDRTYEVGDISYKSFSCLFTANPKPIARLQLGSKAVGTSLNSNNTAAYEYNVSRTITKVEAKDGGIYTCVVSFTGSDMNLKDTAELQVLPRVTLMSRGTINITSPQTINLTCFAAGFPIPDVIWHRALGSGSEVEDVTHLSSSSTDYDNKKNVSILTLKQTSIKEAGVYTCLAMSKDKAANASAKFNSAGQEDFPNVTLAFDSQVAVPPMSVKVSYGKQLELNCTVSAFPPVRNIFWYRNGQKITGNVENRNQNGTTTLSIYKIKRTRSSACGNYSCYSSDSESAVVLVKPNIKADSKTLSTVIGSTNTLSCTAFGCPTPSITWHYKKSGREMEFSKIEMGNKFNITEESYSTTVVSNLTIVSTTPADGVYRCRAASVGINRKDQQLISVSVYHVSSIEISPSNVVIDEGDSLQLNCTLHGNPLLTKVTWTKNPGEGKSLDIPGDRVDVDYFFDSNVVSLTVLKSLPSDTGNYCCQFPGVDGPVRSNKTLVTIRGRPDAVSEIQVSIQATNVTLSWRKPFDGFSPILGYNISYRRNTSSPELHFKELNASTVVSISSLNPYTVYVFRIFPINKLGAANNVSEFTVITNVSAPSAPRNLTIVATSSTTFSASWEEPKILNGPIDGYSVYYDIIGRQRRSSSQPILLNSRSNNSINITGLDKFTWYIVFVKAINLEGDRQLEGPSVNASIRTGQDAPSFPRNVLFVDKSETSLKVTWLPPSPTNGIIQHYQILYQEGSKFVFNNWTRNFSIAGSEETAVIKDLAPYSTYIVAVRAFTIIYGNLSKPLVGRTNEGLASAPRNLTVVDTSSTAVIVSWDGPKYHHGIIQKYLIYLQGTKSYINITGQPTTNTTNTTYTMPAEQAGADFSVQYLWPDFSYTVRVAAVNGGGVGTKSVAVEAKTDVDTPLKPTSGVQLAKATTTVEIELTRPSNRNGKIKSVLLFVARLKAVQTAEEIDFDSASARPYSEDINAGEPYVAAEYDYDNFPKSVTLGDDTETGQYHNVPLKSGSRYAYAMRSISATNMTSTGTAAEVDTAAEQSDGGDRSVAIVGAVVAVVLVVLVVVLILVILRRRRIRKNDPGSNFITEPAKDERVPLSEFICPLVSSLEDEIYCVAESTTVLRVNITTGHPVPKIYWSCSGEDLPGNNRRFELMSDGSLQISDICKEDAGLYECTVSNMAGTSQCQIQLSMSSNEGRIRNPVAMADFEEHVKGLHDDTYNNAGFASEFSDLGEKDSVPSPPMTVAKLECNKSKNRYGNIVPYDHNRIVLEEQRDQPGSDYINASYVDAYGLPKGYIACQGPNDVTTDDFWRMVWQENVRTIIMVTNEKEKGKVKCSKYWPELNQDNHHGPIVVISREELRLPQCVVRTFKLTNVRDEDSENRRIVKHYHFTGWPDHGAPKYAMPLINLIKRAREHQSLNPNSPVVVHCSAGVGRTGAFIVIDYSLEKLKHDKNIDIFNLIKELRAQRPNMVQTVDQYVFCHDAVLEYVLSGNTRVPASDLHNYIQQHSQTDSQTGKTGFENDLQILDKLSPREEMYSYNIGRNDAYAKKIRNASCIPPDGIHVFLSPVPGQGADSTYINAAVIDGYQQSDMYIATQGPLQGTVADFWRLVWEKKILFVVMLTKLEENGEEMSVQYWPSAGTADYAMMSVTLEEEKFLDDYAVRKLLIKNKNDETSDHRSITQFHYLGWPNGQLPKHPVNLLDMIYKIERDQTRAENKSVVVTCSDGIQRCGLFCALSIVIETLKTEQIVDAFQVFRVLRLQNPAFVNGLEEYKFCHDVAQEFLDSFDTYANFKVL